MKRARAQKEALEKALNRHMQNVEEGLEAEYQLAKNNFDSLNAMAADIHARYTPSHLAQLRPLRIAQANLESEEFIYKSLKDKLRQEKIILEIPRNPVEIIDAAKPSNRPVNRQRSDSSAKNRQTRG
ncbi:hypothetical protein [Pontiella sulfatireligans]|uniref:Uncharacterized protein n=1 Tax=Pontiella sulfatireligans TaxID=2750658 RepID=A0A6C2UJT1_9BACT|nr:hypothetical protein [Pontiella sulfatireligans]VGO20358.1 hypothetical protein SCARR_02421 [Pontiella sulfatireligans]